MHKETDRYIKDIKLFFPIFGKQEKEYLAVLKEKITEYEGEHPEVTYSALEEEFGSPSDIIAEYYREVDEDRLFKRMKIRGMLKAVVAVICALLISFVGYYYFLLYCDHMASQNSDTGREYIHYEPYTEE